MYQCYCQLLPTCDCLWSVHCACLQCSTAVSCKTQYAALTYGRYRSSCTVRQPSCSRAVYLCTQNNDREVYPVLSALTTSLLPSSRSLLPFLFFPSSSSPPPLSPCSQFMDILNYSADLKSALEALVVTREVSMCMCVHVCMRVYVYMYVCVGVWLVSATLS